jgi:hypothetical protein
MKLVPARSVALAWILFGFVACGGGATANQLAWCADNQGKVGRVALESGLMPPGTDYTTWKQNNPNDYERACIEAFGG